MLMHWPWLWSRQTKWCIVPALSWEFKFSATGLSSNCICFDLLWIFADLLYTQQSTTNLKCPQQTQMHNMLKARHTSSSAMAESPRDAWCDFKEASYFEAITFYVEELRFAPISMDHYMGEWLYFNFAAGSFHRQIFVAHLIRLKLNFIQKQNQKIAFRASLCGS